MWLRIDMIGPVTFFMTSQATNALQWSVSIWHYHEGEADYSSLNLHTAATWREDFCYFFMRCYFIVHNSLMKIKSWCTTVSILPPSLSCTLTIFERCNMLIINLEGPESQSLEIWWLQILATRVIHEIGDTHTWKICLFIYHQKYHLSIKSRVFFWGKKRY